MTMSLLMLFMLQVFHLTLVVTTTWAFVPASFGVVRPTISHTTTRPLAQQFMAAIDTSDIKNGLTVELDGEPYKVLSFSVMKQARGAAKTTIKFKNLMRGTTIENTYRSGEKFETAQIEKKDSQFTYKEDSNFFFMDSESFETIIVPEKVVGDRARWIGEGNEVKLVMFKDSVIEVIPPSPAVYEIVETEPNVKGNTAQGYTKPATLDCGAIINVPGFLETGSKIRVDTEKGEYIERVNS